MFYSRCICGYPDILKALPYQATTNKKKKKLIGISYEQKCPETGEYMIHNCTQTICHNSTNKRSVYNGQLWRFFTVASA